MTKDKKPKIRRKIEFKREYYTNGQLKTEYRYLGGKKHGLCRGYFETGKLCYGWHYKNGEKHGICRVWYGNGKPKYVHLYKYGKLKRRLKNEK